MLIDKNVNISISSRNIKKYKDLGYDCNLTDIISIDIIHVNPYSRVKINAKCICGNEKLIEYRLYTANILNGRFFSCSKKCSQIKTKNTNLEKYGVTSPMKSSIIKVKVINTNMNKYGFKNVFESQLIKDKIKETCLERYGVEHISQSVEIKDKIRKTNIEKYGVEYYVLFKNFENILRNESFRINNLIIAKDLNYLKYLENKISLFTCDKGHNFEISSENYHSRLKNNIPLCTICNPIGSQCSFKENELFKFIQNNYSGEMIQSYRDGLEIDIYLPELNIGFEFNGLYWHSEKYKDKGYHLNKTNWFKEKDIRIIHIWEDDWTFKREIIKSQIKNLLGKSNNKIYARKCYVKDIKDTKLIGKFLDDNHIQGRVNSSLKLGLYYNEELVSIMTFDQFEGRKKMEEGGYNLNRFCNKLNTNVTGGFSKLLKHFINHYNVSRIVSYADKDWSVGNLYYKIGFINIKETLEDYKYIVANKRVHKSKYRKSRLEINEKSESEEMKHLNIFRIYDCGKIKFEMKL